LAISEILLKNLLDNLGEGVYFVDTKRQISYWNKAAEQISGYSAEDVLGSVCSENILVHLDEQGNSLCQKGCPLEATIRDGLIRESTVYMLHKNGHRVSVSTIVTPLYDDDQKTVGAVEIFRENSQDLVLKERVSNFEKLSLIDDLTEIGNRRFAEITLEAKFNEFKRYGWQFGLIFADIDNFKRVNDSFGHDVGDRVLRLVAKTMKASVRSLDAVFRWGGEEFLNIISNTDYPSLTQIAERVRFMVETSELGLENERLKVTISIGATLAKAEDNPDSIIKRADDLMYQSKFAGKNRVTIDYSSKQN
jgi:diguanylate cyclase (GGDEF)-like protein/PAS domain S-box-containing protein